ncbi:MAG: FAD-dependent oxidoreductase [Clostridia bacterium]|nr:FAD-dependent oxidoreductase [Clostridia bacterium]
MNQYYPKMFEPIKIGNVEIKNRIALEPMLVGVAELDGTAGDKLIAYYGERAKGGTGLIQTEVTRISDWTGATSPLQLSVTHNHCIPGLRKLADECHKYGAKVFVQLHHTGRQTYQLVVTAWKLADVLGGTPVGPLWWKAFFGMTKYFDYFENPFMHHFYLPVVSASNVPTGIGSSPVKTQKTRALTKWEIGKIEDEFAEGARRCKEAGIDGVMLHASHGYLLQQFLSPYTNRREDEYGGSLENRCRIIKEIIEKIRAKCGPDYPITVRLTVDEYYRMYGYDMGLRLDEGVEIAKMLESYGIDAIDISSGTYDTMNSWLEPTTFELGWRKGNAAAVKAAVKIPVIAANLIRTPEQAEKQLEEGTQDIIGLGRPLIADPYWASKAEAGHPEDIQRCICCLYCIESMMHGAMQNTALECALNPRACKELDYSLEPPKDGAGRPVVVIGGGPAGLMAAKTLGQRGFKVTLFEKNDYLGGQFEFAARPPKKEKLRWAIQDLKTACDKAGVEIRVNAPATPESVKALAPIAIIDATGGAAIKPKIPGYDLPNVCTVTEVLTGQFRPTGKNIAVIGSGMTGLETSELLAEDGNKITIVEMAKEIAPGTWQQHLDDVVPKLEAKGTQFITGYKLVEMKSDCVILEDADVPGRRKTVPCDYVVLALGVRATGLSDDIKAIAPTCSVGDAAQVGRVANATHTAYRAALSIK